MALNEYGIPAISMTGSQVGIITESIHGKARILDIKTERIQNYINQGFVVVVAGFQGTTLSHTVQWKLQLWVEVVQILPQ